MANSSAGIKIIRRIDLFFFANRGILVGKFAEKKFHSVAKVLIKDLIVISRTWPVQFPVNKKYPDQYNYKGDLLDQRQVRNVGIAHHDKIIQSHQGNAEQACVKEAIKPALVKANKCAAKCDEPKQACCMYNHIVQVSEQERCDKHSNYATETYNIFDLVINVKQFR